MSISHKLSKQPGLVHLLSAAMTDSGYLVGHSSYSNASRLTQTPRIAPWKWYSHLLLPSEEYSTQLLDL